MTLRARIAAVSGLAVAVAVLLAAVAVYLAVRTDLRSELDRSLQQRAAAFTAPPPDGGGALPDGDRHYGDSAGPPPAPPGAGRFAGAGAAFPSQVQPLPLGGPSGFVQFLSPTGVVHVPAGQGTSRAVAPSASDRRIAHSGSGSAFSDRDVGSTRVRVLTLGTGSRGAVMVARPLSEVERELHRVLAILAIVGVVGIAIAAALGAAVARAALAPIARFTRRTETLAGTLDTSQRLPEQGGDELARLAHSFNATLDALERSVAAQRNLVADASHELRTPIASLRANIQVLAEADRLPPADQQALREDIVGELDELTRLVGDVVELARGSAGEGAHEPTRLDQIVESAVERARRRGGPQFELQLQPTTIRADAAHVDRAVANLLENARKWSTRARGEQVGSSHDKQLQGSRDKRLENPPHDDGTSARGAVEVSLRGGVLSVRDHGPGFREQDLARVFERFYRADDARGLPGSGLGLAIVRQTAEAHGGWARAQNAPGGGALLQVSFGAPIALAAPEVASR